MITAAARKNVATRLSAALSVLITLLLAHATAARADDVPPELFFTIPPSAATLGRGTVSTSGAMDASDIYRFTANSALAEGGLFLVGQAERRDGVKTVYSAAALPVFYTGTLGIFTRGVPSPGDYSAPNSFGASLAKYYKEYRYGVGGHLAFLESDVLGKQEYFASFGLNLRLDPSEAFSGHAYLISSGLPLRLKNSMFSERLADQFGVSASYYPLRGVSDFWGLDLGAGAQVTGDGPAVLGASAEVSVDSRLFLRIGYENPVKRGLSASGLSLGAGFLVGGLGMDAAYRFGTKAEGSGVWAVNAKVHIEQLKRRTAEANLALALKHFDRGNFERAIFYSQRALAADPINWGALALQIRANAELRRVASFTNKAVREFAIIYGGNARGRAIPYPPSPDALGGLSRYAAVVSSLRRDWPVNFTIDAGNILGAKNDELRIELAAAYYDIMNFDAIAPGEGEMAVGPFEFMAAQKRALPVVISNLGDNNAQQSEIWSSLLLTNSGINVYVVNMISRSVAPDSIGKGLTDISYHIGELRTLLNGPRAAGADIRAAVIHGTMAEIRQIAEALPEINIIIAGSLEERFHNPVKIGQTLVLSAGSGHKFAGRLSVKVNEKRRKTADRFAIENRLYPVYQDIAPDPAVENAARLVDAAVTVEEGSESETFLARVNGVFSYLSDRGKGPRAFIKAVESLREYPLGDDIPQSRAARFSPAGNSAAFIYGKPEEMNGKLRMVDLSMMKGRTVSSGKNVTDAAFSPADGFLYYIEADSGSETGAIYKTKTHMYDAIAVVEQNGSPRRDLSVSDDGATLLFCTKTEGRWQIYAVDSSAATALVKLTEGDADHRLPRMCPNGRYVAYLSNSRAFGAQMDLWIYDRQTAAHRQFTFNSNVRDFCWGENSETIFFSAGVNLLDIYIIDLEETAVTRMVLPQASRNYTKGWSEKNPRFIYYNEAPKILYTREYVDGVRRLHWYDIKRRVDERVFSFDNYNEWVD